MSISPEDFAFLRENNLNASVILREGIATERATRTPEKALERLDREQETIDRERRRFNALIVRQQAMTGQESALDVEILRNIRAFPQCPTPPPQVMSSIWGWVREHHEDFHILVSKYVGSNAIVERIRTTWISNHHRIVSEVMAKAAPDGFKAASEKKGGGA